MTIRKDVLGEDHPDTLHTMTNLGDLYVSQGRYDVAGPLYLEALAAQERVLGKSHPETTRTLYSLACLEALRGNGDRATDWLRRSGEAGYTNADWMAADPDLESLHGPEFDALVARAREGTGTWRTE